MKESRQTFLNLFFILWLLLLLKTSSSSPPPRGKDPRPPSLPFGLYKGHTCVGCVLVVSVIEQLAQWHNSTVKAAMERLCDYIPEKLQGFCYVLAELYGPHIAELIDREMNADVVCHSLRLCKQDPGQLLCHLYSPPKVGLSVAIRKAKRIMKTSKDLKSFLGFSSVCAFPLLANLCEKIKYVLRNKLPFEDFDGDKFSTFPTLRGYHWRGRDCNDKNTTVYPGRRPDNWDAKSDSNCNGIWGVDPKDGIPYEEKFCKGADSKGVVLLGDSAGAHFHIPPEWMTVTQMSAKSFANLPMAFSDELDWPQFSEITGFLNSTIGGWTDSLYLRLRKRNRCNHRDLQNISQNGGSSGNLLSLIKSLARNQLLDNPAIVIYATIGNDVCNGERDTLAHMTTPKEMLSNVVQALRYLDSHLPNGSHVILTGLVDGRFLWDNLHDRYHPLGQLNKDVTYSQLYTFLDCLQVSPCSGWLTPNETLRNLTSERALQLSNVLKEIARSEKFANFDIFYMDFPLRQTAEEWRKMGGEPWQLIEPVDGFHPNQPLEQALPGRGRYMSGLKCLARRIHSTTRLKPYSKIKLIQCSQQNKKIFKNWRQLYPTHNLTDDRGIREDKVALIMGGKDPDSLSFIKYNIRTETSASTCFYYSPSTAQAIITEYQEWSAKIFSGEESEHVNKYRRDYITGWVQHTACGKALLIVSLERAEEHGRGGGCTQQCQPGKHKHSFLLSLHPKLLLAAGAHVLTTQSLCPEVTIQVSFST
ncbi:Acyloxyacyl hydrolase [Lamprotornis superbus]|uniref:Acyloxyacyl hydrolase n=1 Tax=Lamprotornis superbus TaxID=245042 RepID=A0A835TV43_9PASS|nr:Acyloxyacyl hydrolase [Lamprotornis superbus]